MDLFSMDLILTNGFVFSDPENLNINILYDDNEFLANLDYFLLFLLL